ncbi:NAD(P)H-dependent glycerol-3-phosphate dehydrogenase [Frigidibacter sp. MR17.14]|uniref:NAD(P)H-dependent glycerol-3-phosphate dehydrogenase n=1 Tax=Frigidibacter sp. MR17.14 TaxID=3126509 RepID=UPI003012CC25
MISVLGAGAFGGALAVALARSGQAVTLWARSGTGAMDAARALPRLPGVTLPEGVAVEADLGRALAGDGPVLLALPMQATAGFLEAHGAGLAGRPVVACSKGIDLGTLEGPSAVIARLCPGAVPAVLTGPSFAADIARGLPTALTLATADAGVGAALQRALSTPVLRLYLSDDPKGAELGGALKNVVAIAAGVAIGAGLGDSARAALMTRGFAEMSRIAVHLGARAETLAGLSGFGDLVLTCTSDGSRNFRFGLALGRGEGFDPTVTVEGLATAEAVVKLAAREGVEMPVAGMVAALARGRITVAEAAEALLTRPLRKE